MTKSRGPNPKIRCSVCGRELSQYHLARHQGTFDCVRDHHVRKQRTKFALAPDRRSIGSYYQVFLWWAFKEAGFDVHTAPLSMETLWPSNENFDAPYFTTVGPVWAVLAAQACSDRKNPSALDIVELAKHLHESEAPEKVEARLALAMELELSCMNDPYGDGWLELDIRKARRVLRRWASAALGGTFPIE